MRSTLTLSCRRLLQADAGSFDADGNTILTHRNVSSTAVREPFTPSTPFDTSIALTILIILTALFFMGFFSVYIRRLSGDSNPSTASSTNARPAPSKGSGLDPSAVNLLPLVAYNRAEKHPMMEDCPICLSEFQEEERVKQIPYCGHVFHPTCIDTWLASHVTCPFCRSTKLFREV